MKRAVYDKQFKMAAEKYSQSVAQSVKDVARERGIIGTTLRHWINEYDEYYLYSQHSKRKIHKYLIFMSTFS
ncbi:hypothetical protein SDC9_159793 [bioreactor metagenome]|uniref:Transposase n=1 Tax=bioreactor metagenome TaxID=1076179 RepID=A0A645FDJ3_9ZZZZ